MAFLIRIRATMGLLRKYVLSWDTRKLTQAALETLAVIAYNQPITRAGVTSVRGVNSDSPINSLVEKGLVREAGRDKNAPGQPILYAHIAYVLGEIRPCVNARFAEFEDFAPDEVQPRADSRAFGRRAKLTKSRWRRFSMTT